MNHILALAAFALPQAPSDGPLLPVEQQELTPAEVTAGDWFGSSAAVDGERAVVAALADDHAGTWAGSVYVLLRTGGGWTSEAKLTRPGAASGDAFGYAVGISGDVVVVGAPLEDGAGLSRGAAHAFVRGGSGWSHAEMLLGSDIDSHDHFGTAVAVDGDRLVVGAYRAGGVTRAGRAYVFERGVGGWVETQILASPTNETNERFGAAVDLDGERLLVGAPKRDQGDLLDAGAAFVFVLQGGSFVHEAMLSAPYAMTTSWQGEAVALDGPLAVVGAPHQQGAGTAFLFSREGGAWEFERQLAVGPAQSSDAYGFRVAIDGEVVAVGAQDRDVPETGSGQAFVFTRQNGVFRLSAEASPADHGPAQQFGSAVAVQGFELLVGSQIDSDAGAFAGSLYVFGLEPALRSFCAGDGSAAACPCGNESSAERGCANSSGVGAGLGAIGSVSVAVDDLRFAGFGLPPGQPTLLFAGTAAVNGGAGVVLGDGLLCVGGAVRRLGVRQVGAGGGVQFGPELAAAGGWSGGDTRNFQLWYRDPAGPCGQGVNLSAALEARFTP